MVVEARSYSFHFGRTRVGDRQGLLRQLFGQNIPDPQLVRRVEIGEKQTHSDRFDLCDRRISPPRRAAPPSSSSGDHHLPIGIDALVEFKTMPALDQRLGLDPAHVVVGLAVATLNEGHVAKAFGRHISNDGALAFQNGVGGNGRADAQISDRWGNYRGAPARR